MVFSVQYNLLVVMIGFIQTDGELRYVVDSGVPFHVGFIVTVLTKLCLILNV